MDVDTTRIVSFIVDADLPEIDPQDDTTVDLTRRQTKAGRINPVERDATTFDDYGVA